MSEHNKRVRCPQCKKELPERIIHFPFCSERCKLLDLGAWASGKYAIPAVEQELDDSEDPGERPKGEEN